MITMRRIGKGRNNMALKDCIKFNKDFKSGINLYLNLNKIEKINSYIPTSSSLRMLDDYINAVLGNKEQATILIGPYGKGKSHLLLVLLSLLSMNRTKDNEEVIDGLINRIDIKDDFGKTITNNIKKVWEKRPFLPVILNSTNGDLNQAFLIGLKDALTRAELKDLIPDTYYSVALDRIENWKDNYPETYSVFEKKLAEHEIAIDEFLASLKLFSPDALRLFQKVYPSITAGSEFNPLTVSEVLPLYKNISEQLAENYGYSGIYIVFDEFSKYIEGQDGKAAGNNMKLLQDMCELASDSSQAQIFITFVAHKSIKEYGEHLSKETINAFTGIEGRLVEKYFITSSKNNYELIKNAIIKTNEFNRNDKYIRTCLNDKIGEEYYDLPVFKTNFQYADFVNIIQNGCYPLNPIASYLLLNISEKVAQNERTLFTFISNDEPNSLARFVNNHESNQPWTVGADLIYDYFKGLFKKEVTNEMIHNIWLSAEYAIEKCDTDAERSIVKALAVILAVNKPEELSSSEKNVKLSIHMDDLDEGIETLKNKNLIYKRGVSDTLAFKTRAGSVLKTEIKKRRDIKGDNVDFSKVLKTISGKSYVIPRRYNTENMITRYFSHEYMSVDTFLNINDVSILFDEKCIDGKVLTLFTFKVVKLAEVRKHYKELNCNRLVVVAPSASIDLKKQLIEYDIIQDLKANTLPDGDNDIFKRELPIFEEDIALEVNSTLYDVYGEESDAHVLYMYRDKVMEERSTHEEAAVNSCCDDLFKEAPHINNEIINRNVLTSGQTKKARINIINALLTHSDTSEFYSGTNQEATIYRSLFVRTGLKDGIYVDRNLARIIAMINNFVDESSDKKTSMDGLIDKLISEPYGMRRGVLPIYLAFAFSQRKEDLIFYLSGLEIQLDANVLVNICDTPREYSLYVSKRDIQKEKYIAELNQRFSVLESRNLTENRIKNISICIQRWYRNLPQVARNLIEVDSIYDYVDDVDNMRSLRKVLQNIDVNPYEMLFVMLPKLFKTDDLDVVIQCLDKTITNFEDYFRHLINIVIQDTFDVFDSKKKQDLNHLLKEWYKKQSKLSKEGLHGNKVTSLMSYVENLNAYDDEEIAKSLAKIVTDVYLEDWTNETIEEYKNTLKECKQDVEAIKDESTAGKLKLSFVDSKGNPVEKYYVRTTEGTGSVLKNIIEDALDEYDDLSANDRVSILLDMIEKIIK